jgi:hypothetical protein
MMFICEVTGMRPMNGRVNRSRLGSLADSGFAAPPPPDDDDGPRERVSGPPPAGRLVIVDEAEDAGRAPSFGLGAVSFRNQSAKDVFGFAGDALAMMVSVLLRSDGGAGRPP